MATAFAWQESDTKHRQGGLQEKRVCTSLSALGCLINALYSTATPAEPFQGMPDEHLPPLELLGFLLVDYLICMSDSSY